MPVMSWYTSAAVFLFSAISLILPSGMSPGAAMLCFGSIVLLWTRGRPTLRREELALSGVFLLYFLVCALTGWVHSDRLREYDEPLRFVLAIPALFLLLKYRPAACAYWASLIAGAGGAGALAAWERLALSEVRAHGYTNPIQYGNISMLLGVLCLAGLGWAMQQRHRRLWVGLLVCAAAAGILGSFLTASRGSWVSLPVCLLILYRYYGKSFPKRYLLAGGLVAAIGLAAILTAPRLHMQSRFTDAVTETDGYFENGNANTSVGARFEMWRTALMIFPEHPWLGWGKAGFMERKKDLIAAGQVAAFTGEHTHSHNEYLDALVKRGLLGLAALLLFYAVQLWVFWRGLMQAAPAQRPYALAGVLVMTSYIGFGLTQAFLSHNNGVMTLGFMLVILLSLMRPAPVAVTTGHAPDMQT